MKLSTVHLQRGESSRCGSKARVLTTEAVAVTCGLCLRLMRHEARTAEWMAERDQAASGYSPRESPAPPLQAERLLRDFANAVRELASKGYRHLDADEESKAMKVLSALAGVPGCYPEIDKLYARIESGR